jgi:hypothetical protein
MSFDHNRWLPLKHGGKRLQVGRHFFSLGLDFRGVLLNPGLRHRFGVGTARLLFEP